MNLTDFETTSFRGLFKSKIAHPKFGKKYIARFQLNKKRYVKVLGYEKADKLTELKAFTLLQDYKTLCASGKKTILKNKSKEIDPIILQDGIQKIYDNEELKQYQIELIKMQNYLEKTNKKMIVLFEGRDASGKGGAIRRITRYMNARHYRVVALGKPTETQKYQWFFQKYIEHFPTGEKLYYLIEVGTIVLW